MKNGIHTLNFFRLKLSTQKEIYKIIFSRGYILSGPTNKVARKNRLNNMSFRILDGKIHAACGINLGKAVSLCNTF